MDQKPVNELSGDEVARELADLEELDRLTKSLYMPYDKQKEFHCAPNTIRAVFGGNRSGKSEMGVNEVRFHTTGQYPDWYPEDKRWNMPTKGRIVVKDYKKGCGEVVEPKIRQWFDPESIIKMEKSMGNLSKVYIRHITGGVSVFDIMTHEQDSLQFEGWNGHWVWFDEPPPRDKYIACLRGLIDFEGRAWITATPLSEPWLFDEVMNNPKQDVWHIAISTFDNPYLTKKGIDILLGSMTPEEEEARIHGKFMHLTGRIYKDFDTSTHIIDRMPGGYQTWPVYFALDPADRRAHHGIWARIDPLGTLYIFDELVFKGNIEQTAREIVVRERSQGINPENVFRVLDPNKGQSPVGAQGIKLKDEFAKYQVYFTTKVDDDLALGHMAVRERLYVPKGGYPKLVFLKGMTNECVRQLLSYVWDEWKGNSAASKAEKEKPKDINKDMPDCIRYLVMINPVWFNQNESSGEPYRATSYTGYDL